MGDKAEEVSRGWIVTFLDLDKKVGFYPGGKMEPLTRFKQGNGLIKFSLFSEAEKKVRILVGQRLSTSIMRAQIISVIISTTETISISRHLIELGFLPLTLAIYT